MILPTGIRNTGFILQKNGKTSIFTWDTKCLVFNKAGDKSDAINASDKIAEVFEICLSVFV